MVVAGGYANVRSRSDSANEIFKGRSWNKILKKRIGHCCGVLQDLGDVRLSVLSRPHCPAARMLL